jgi:hypothetical protein
MNLIGIQLRKPSFNELTSAAVLATGLFLLALGVMRMLGLPMDRVEAGALLLVVFWGCVSVRLGIRIGEGHRHMVANLMVSAVLLGAYQAAWTIAG